MSEKLTVIYTAEHIHDAHLLVSLLAERDIAAEVLGEPLQGALGGLPLGSSTSPQVVVAEKNARKAREVAIAMQRQIEIGPPRFDEQPGEEAEDWADWPTCPECGRRRQTVCPICDTAGTDFPLAEYNVVGEPVRNLATGVEPESQSPAAGDSEGASPECAKCARSTPRRTSREEESGILLMCPTCDEAFHPKHYRYCQWCGFDHGSGIEPRRRLVEHVGLTTRAIVVMVGLALIAGATILYLWWLSWE